MKLGAALSELKNEKSQLARLIQIRKDVMYVKEDKKPAFDAKKLTDQINKKMDEIRELKIKIMKTNLQTKIGDLNLAEAILKVSDLRSKISNLTDLIELNRRDWLTRRRDDDVELIPQVEESEIEKEIRELEQEKVRLDNEIQKVNWSVDLVE